MTSPMRSRSAAVPTVELSVSVRLAADPEQTALLAARLLESFEDVADLALSVRTIDDEDGVSADVVELAAVRRERAAHRAEPALRIETEARRAVLRGKPLPMTRLEFDLLLFLSTHPDVVFDRETLKGRVWGSTYGCARTVDVHIRKIRSKLEPLLAPISTVRGIGYRFDRSGDVTVV